MNSNIYNINLLKKNEIHKKYIKSNKSILILSYSIIIILILFDFLFGLYSFVLEDTFVVQDIYAYNYGEKNYTVIWCVLITVNLIVGFLWIVLKISVYRIYGKYISERINESLIINDFNIEYGYQNLIGSTNIDRVIVRIPIQDIKKIKINRLLSRLEIVGKISSKYYDDYINKETRAPENNFKDSSLVLFDYFEPGILQYFEKNHMEKLEEE